MNPILRNILITVAAIIIGGLVNGAIIALSSSLVPLPEGIDPTDMNSLKENIHRFEVQHFIMPFLAHALGTLVGGFLSAKFSASHHRLVAFLVGIVFLAAGIANVMMLPAPMWFNVLDLVVAYIPMAYLGWKLSGQPVR